MNEVPPSENRGKLIVGVDDDAANLAFLKANLVTAGYTFLGAANGLECLGLVLRAPPRLILLDIEMPLIDGFETCRRLRAIADFASVPIAFLTARKTREDVKLGLSVGGNDFIIKPFKREHLLERVNYWMSHRPGAAAPPTSTSGSTGPATR